MSEKGTDMSDGKRTNDMVTVHFRLKDTVLSRSHKGGEWEFYDGTYLRFFAGRPIMWWPEGAQAGLPMDELAGSELRFSTEDGRPDGAVVVEMRLPRADLAKERRAAHTIVDDEGPAYTFVHGEGGA